MGFINQPSWSFPSDFIEPNFQLPLVCRQIYIEAAAMIYTDNIFLFSNNDTMDRWIKSIPIGRQRDVTMLDIPCAYLSLYRNGARKPLHSKFPNLKRVGINEKFITFVQVRGETTEQTRERIEQLIHDQGGEHLEVEWYSLPAPTL